MSVWLTLPPQLRFCQITSINILSKVESPALSQSLTQQFSAIMSGHTGVPQEFLKHAKPGYLVRGTDLFPLDCQIKNDSQHNNSCLVGMNQNYTYFLVQIGKKYNTSFWCAAEF